MLAQALEYIVGRHVRSGIRQRFLDALSQPIVERGIFPVESPHGRDLGAQDGSLADIFQAGSVTGRLDFP